MKGTYPQARLRNLLMMILRWPSGQVGSYLTFYLSKILR